MQGDPEVLKLLNEQLTSELTAINQYFLHSKMQDNWGFTELARHTREESFEEMRHAETITDRILLLDGLPNYQRLFSLRVGQTLREQFESDLAIEYEVVARLKPGIIMCREKQDAVSANLLEQILGDEEKQAETWVGVVRGFRKAHHEVAVVSRHIELHAEPDMNGELQPVE